ncbi:ARMT1-like domain-containing protein [Alkalispirochaeta americana]|nr:ARMT1-like domain-containing protein [Alkalispirochaeta americana]
MTERFPRIIHSILQANPTYPGRVQKRLEELSRKMVENGEIPPLVDSAFDQDQWNCLYRSCQGQGWQETEWFFAETYAYRLLLEACEYFSTLKDPFGPLKERELEQGTAFWPLLAEAETRKNGGAPGTPRSLKEELLQALLLSLWGNRADLSFSGGTALDTTGEIPETLVAQDDQPALDHLLGLQGASEEAESSGREIHLVLDNTGSELAADVALSLTLRRLLKVPLVLHLKLYPTYVSDTTVADLHRFLDVAATHPREEVRSRASAFGAALKEGAIRLAPDDFWCQPLFLADAPPRITRALDRAGMVIFKGDLNYRRAMHDTIWPPGTPLAEAIRCRHEAPWLFLRTIKSDCLAGVSRERCQALQAEDPSWRTSGTRGLLQLASD